MMQVIVTGKWTQGIEEILKELDDKMFDAGFVLRVSLQKCKKQFIASFSRL